MKNYELTIVLAGGATAVKKKKIQVSVEKLIKTYSGTLEKVEDWGEKELFYKIKGSAAGVFLHFKLKLEAESVKQISAKLNFEEDVLRHLLVKTER